MCSGTAWTIRVTGATRRVSLRSRSEVAVAEGGSSVQAIGIIGGSGLTRLKALEIERQEIVTTPYGDPSAPLTFGHFDGSPVVFLPRHGASHGIPPHRVNYRANLWALREAGVRHVVGMAAVGGITAPLGPGMLAVPDQVIDYTWGREHTLFEGDGSGVTHVDFTNPYCAELRDALLQAARSVDIEVYDGGTYGATQGPRLESKAEIVRLERDGCDMVGMTGMPETALARELGLCYACFALSVNWAAGKTEGPITMAEIDRYLEQGMARARRVLAAVASA
ncbi:MAG: S-methyl-5'-thioinosine phosphorylase [Chromatiaceae bacterium]|nr:S-methyl-5'-thioinosine phosphorylase [Chromatiaceae bacterium]MCP5312037.1 S-methyl-5'-thioinosine phosphorylase [Chromatiaceae bacterium]